MKTSGSKLAPLFLSLFISSTLISNATASDDFDRLYSQAKKEMDSELGGFYAMQLNSTITENHARLLDECAENSKGSNKQLFFAVLEINSNGTIKAFHLGKKTDLGTCLKSRFVGLEVPMPPYDGYLTPFNWGAMR